jgi:isoleucyl-tRNA synthetase
MTSVALNGVAPYKTVITHGFVVDKDTKKKISKSEQGGYKKPMEADYFVNKYGADIVRLWAASTQFTDDVPFSEENFTRISESYRGFRNVLRILLANLHDFDVNSPDRSSHLKGATTVDRWVLSKLQGVIARCRAAYEAYDFREVYETLNNFCAVELSALYVDITKDRMYCDRADSPRRRATQAVMAACFEAVAKLLAPILAYTADEAWEFSGRTKSLHVETFASADDALRNAGIEETVDEWLKLRSSVYQQGIEPARQAKTIAKSLEASVELQVPDARRGVLESNREELEEFFIVSELQFTAGDEPLVKVIRSGAEQCPRCWRRLPLVETGVCARCAEAQ